MTIPKYKYVDIPLGEPEPEYHSTKKGLIKANMRGKMTAMKAFMKMKQIMKSGNQHESYHYAEEEEHGYGHGHDDHDDHGY